jgi:hypothetical protein
LPLDHYQLNKFSDLEDGNWRELSEVITDLYDDTLTYPNQATPTDDLNNLGTEAARTPNLTPGSVIFSGRNNSGLQVGNSSGPINWRK